MSRIYSEEEKSEYLEAYHQSGKSKTEFSREKIYQRQHFEYG